MDKSTFTKHEADLLLNLINECHRISSTLDHNKVGNDFDPPIRNILQELIPHQMFAYGYAELTTLNAVKCINHGFPKDYIDRVAVVDGKVKSPAIRGWCSTLLPSFFNSKTFRPTSIETREWTNALLEYAVKNVAVHGVIDVARRTVTCFCLGRLDETWGPRYNRILHAVVPHLHSIFSTVTAKCAPDTLPQLTPREIEVVRWLALGKSVSDISVILGISACTVRTYNQRILSKLGVSNRAHAVSRAIQCGLVNL